jgi:hypothetical protein
MARRLAFLAAVVSAALLAVVVWRLGPALTLSLSLAAPATEPWIGRLLAHPVREEIEIASERGQLLADLYRPPRPRGALLLVHGLSRAGRRQPDLVRLARLLGQQGQLVLVPHFEGLAAFTLSGREVDEVRAALRYTVGLNGSAGIAGFSFGAGPALLGAAEFPELRVVASFGGYADLRHVIAYISTGAHDFDGHRYLARQEEYNRWKLLAVLVGFVQGARDRSLLSSLAERKLVNPGDDTSEIELALGAEGRAILALCVNRRADMTDRLVAELPAGAREAISRLSPLSAVARMRARLLIVHGTADNSIPFTESLRLAGAAEERAHLALFRTFHHTGPRLVWASFTDHARDGWNLVSVADQLLAR